MTDAPLLPTGWTLQRIRDVSGDHEAIPLRTNRTVTWSAAPEDPELAPPAIVLGFHDLCLVQLVDDTDWYMGSLNDDGSVGCWATYGDFYQALRGL
ncbi:hypothetical protein [Streptomyces albireticuli]|uniref:Uncharacterized protein n=1 Tax=Streptomyces albireticuli TaxID=1940 RepID=A0A2A2D5X7_9ACTN|nr:hypothetical protein [Streptomyces albireticuli]MCD9165760.1 hypothetical protein [Streptomyces albireticuli]MCD9195978.1 hypothetical protein [Streptomyces albireticuli]PAU46924.1 hypothetical protein CK936_21765 [Streptomyces albireticuli]